MKFQPQTERWPAWMIGACLAFVVLLAFAWLQQAIVPERANARRHAPLASTDNAAFEQPANATPTLTTNEEIVAGNLAWLAALQQADGSWLPLAASEAGKTEPHVVTETTALVLLAFESFGQTHRSGKYAQNVRKGLDYLVREGRVDEQVARRVSEGESGTNVNSANQNTLTLPKTGCTPRSQALATLALCAHYADTQDPQLKMAAQHAVNQLGATQHIPSGAWLDAQDHSIDSATAGWHLLALTEAHMSYLDLSSVNLPAFDRWLIAQAKTIETKDSAGQQLPGSLLMAFGKFGHRQHWSDQIQSLSQQPIGRRSRDEVYFAARTISEYCDTTDVFKALQRSKDELRNLDDAGDVQATALRIMTLRIYPPLITRQAVEDDFPL